MKDQFPALFANLKEEKLTEYYYLDEEGDWDGRELFEETRIH